MDPKLILGGIAVLLGIILAIYFTNIACPFGKSCARIQICGVCRRAQVSMGSVRITNGWYV